MFLNTKLQFREKPIKVAFIGCGKFVSMFLAQYNQLQKITIDTIVDINIDNAKKNCFKSGLTTKTVDKINLVTSLDEAIVKKDINKDQSIRLDDVELNLLEDVVKARKYQYDLI